MRAAPSSSSKGAGSTGSGLTSAPRRSSRPPSAGRTSCRRSPRSRPPIARTTAPAGATSGRSGGPGVPGSAWSRSTGRRRHRALHRGHRARPGSGRRPAQPRPRLPGRPGARTPTRRCSTAPPTSCRASSSSWRPTAPERRRPTRSAASPGSSPTGGYHLLLGLRRHRDWTAVRPHAFAAGLDGLRRAFRVVVADVDADLEGERTTGLGRRRGAEHDGSGHHALRPTSWWSSGCPG